MGYTFDNGREKREFMSKYELVEHACKNGSPFLEGDSNLVELTKWCAVENNDLDLIEKLEDAGHDMSEYIDRHKARETKLKTQLLAIKTNAAKALKGE